jgi:hypothetical protein
VVVRGALGGCHPARLGGLMNAFALRNAAEIATIPRPTAPPSPRDSRETARTRASRWFAGLRPFRTRDSGAK